MGKTYQIGDERWPSVTTVVGLAPGRATALAEWRAKTPDAEERMELASARGTAVHAAIERCERPDLGDGQEWPDVETWITQFFRYPPLRELTIVSTEHRYAGTADLVGRRHSGKRAIVDIKTGRIYSEHALQITAYARADGRLRPDGDLDSWEGAEEGWVLQVTPGGLKAYRARIDQATFDVFLGLRAAWEWTNGVRRGAILRARP